LGSGLWGVVVAIRDTSLSRPIIISTVVPVRIPITKLLDLDLYIIAEALALGTFFEFAIGFHFSVRVTHFAICPTWLRFSGLIA
jgi:hypothetical protein